MQWKNFFLHRCTAILFGSKSNSSDLPFFNRMKGENHFYIFYETLQCPHGVSGKKANKLIPCWTALTPFHPPLWSPQKRGPVRKSLQGGTHVDNGREGGEKVGAKECPRKIGPKNSHNSPGKAKDVQNVRKREAGAFL